MSNSASDDQGKKSSQEIVPRLERLPLDGDIEFIGDFDILQAKGINISEGGIAFEIEGGLPFEMRFQAEDETKTYRAELVWMKRLPHGGYRMGLKFVGESEEQIL